MADHLWQVARARRIGNPNIGPFVSRRRVQAGTPATLTCVLVVVTTLAAAHAQTPIAATPVRRPTRDAPAGGRSTNAPVAPQNPAQQTPKPVPPAQAAPTSGPVIGDIIVTGNKTLTSTYITIASGHKIGDPCTDQTLSEIETNLVKTGLFGEHSADPDQWVRVHSEEYNPPNGKCKVFIQVDENDTIRSVSVTGSGPIKPEEIRKLLHVDLKTGSVYNSDQFVRDFQDIQDLYRRNGYIASPGQDAGPDTKDPSVLDVPIIVARVAQINIAKTHKTKSKVILREMKTKVGDYFNQFTLDGDRVRLYNLDLFDDVVVDTRTLGPGRIGITISVVEKRTGNVNFGVGYGNRSQLIGFANLGDSNFRGMDEQLNLTWEVGTLSRRSTEEIGFTEPWLDRRQTALSLQVYDRNVYRFSNAITNNVAVSSIGTVDNRYIERRVGSTITVSRPFMSTYRLALTARGENVQTSALNLSPQNLQIVQDGPIYSVAGALIHNTRDLDLDPVRGQYQTVGLEVGHAVLSAASPLITVGTFGPVNFIKGTLEERAYFSLQGPRRKSRPDEEKRSVALRLLLGNAVGTLPFFEQYFVGGAETLRGYREDRFWGKHEILGSVEYRHPLARRLKGVLFLDIGDAWGGPYANVNLSGFRQSGIHPHLGTGFGVRVATPLGPLRLDIGFGDEGGRVHFSFGNVF